VPASVPGELGTRILLAPVQGSPSLRSRLGARVAAAVRGGLAVRGYQTSASHDLLGQALITCQTPECVEEALDAAQAVFAIVPAIWLRESGGEELTLTLVRRSGRSLNASGMVRGDLAGVTDGLVGELLARRAGTGSGTVPAAGSGSAAVSAAGSAAESAAVAATAEGRGRSRAWKAGPIVLIAGGVAAIVAIGIAAGTLDDHQQLNGSAVGAWAAVGAAAIGGGIAWWVVGERRRRKKGDSRAALTPELAFHPTKIDLTLRF